MPVVRTCVDPHMPIAVTENSLQHWPSPSKRRPVFHSSATVGQVCRTGLTTGERVIDFSVFDLGGLPLGRKSRKAEMTYYSPRSTTLQNLRAIAQTVFEIYQTFQSLALILDPSRSSKVKSDGASRKPVGPTYKCSLGSNLVSVAVFEIFRVKILTVDHLTLAGLTPGPTFT